MKEGPYFKTARCTRIITLYKSKLYPYSLLSNPSAVNPQHQDMGVVLLWGGITDCSGTFCFKSSEPISISHNKRVPMQPSVHLVSNIFSSTDCEI